jgi:hypothetical protein
MPSGVVHRIRSVIERLLACIDRGRFLPGVRLSIRWMPESRLVAPRDTFPPKPATISLILRIVCFDLYISFGYIITSIRGNMQVTCNDKVLSAR